jgi:NPCBM/NEW2 domain
VASQPTSSESATPPPVQGSASASQYLGDLSPVADSGSLYTGESAAVNGHYYTNSIVLYMNPGPASVEYNLGRQWRKLDMTVGLRDDSADNQSEQFQILANGRAIYTRVFALGQSQHIVINVSGVLHIELEATLVSPNYVGAVYAVWGRASLSS